MEDKQILKDNSKEIVPEPIREANGQLKKGVILNPNGRPAGAKNFTTKIKETITMRKLWCKFISKGNFYTNIKFVPVINLQSSQINQDELIPYVLVNNRILAADSAIVGTTYGTLSEIVIDEALISTYLCDVELAFQWQDGKNITISLVGTTLPYVVVSHIQVGNECKTNSLDTIEEVKEHVRTYLTLR